MVRTSFAGRYPFLPWLGRNWLLLALLFLPLSHKLGWDALGFLALVLGTVFFLALKPVSTVRWFIEWPPWLHAHITKRFQPHPAKKAISHSSVSKTRPPASVPARLPTRPPVSCSSSIPWSVVLLALALAVSSILAGDWPPLLFAAALWLRELALPHFSSINQRLALALNFTLLVFIGVSMLLSIVASQSTLLALALVPLVRPIEEHDRRLWWVALAIGLLWLGADWGAGPLRSSGILTDPNTLAAFILIPLAFACSDWLAARASPWPVFAAGLLLALTDSRGGINAMAVLLLAGLALERRWLKRAGPTLLLFALMLAGWAVLLFGNGLGARYSAALSDARLQIYPAALAASLERPLFGWGEVLGRWSGSSLADPNMAVVLSAGHAHDIFLQFALQFGWPAALFLAVLLLQAESSALRAGSLACAMLLLAWLVYGLTDTFLWLAHMNILFFWMVYSMRTIPTRPAQMVSS